MAFIRLESLRKYIRVQNNFSDHLCNARWDGWPSFGWRAFGNISESKTTFQIIFAMLVGMAGLHSAGEPSEIYQSPKQLFRSLLAITVFAGLVLHLVIFLFDLRHTLTVNESVEDAIRPFIMEVVLRFVMYDLILPIREFLAPYTFPTVNFYRARDAIWFGQTFSGTLISGIAAVRDCMKRVSATRVDRAVLPIACRQRTVFYFCYLILYVCDAFTEVVHFGQN